MKIVSRLSYRDVLKMCEIIRSLGYASFYTYTGFDIELSAN